MTKLLLRWGIQKGFAVPPKSLNPERMRQNIDLFGFEIDDADMALIETWSAAKALPGLLETPATWVEPPAA